MGSLIEVALIRYTWEDLSREEIKARGEVLLARRRSGVDGLDVDLMVEGERSV